MNQKIKWGIAGLGNIAKKFASDLNLVPEAQLVAVASSDIHRAESFKRDFNADRCYGSYTDLFDDPEVVVVYVAGLNNHHKTVALAAVAKGKAVLCEKPLGLNSGEIKQMIAAANNNQCFLMEALWSRFNPAIQRAKKWSDEGRLGEVRFLYSEFSFYKMDADPSHRLMDLNKGGGALYDIGIYPIFLSYLILGMPEKINAQSQFGPTGVDVQTSMIFQYENAQAILYCGITNNSDNEAKICGTEAEIVLPGRWHDTEAITLIRNGEATTTELPTLGIGYTNEINEVNQCIAQGKIESSLWSNQNALELALLIEKVRDISGIKN